MKRHKNTDHVNEHFRRNSRMKYLKERIRECETELRKLELEDLVGRY
jgi:hypothetical protein